MINKRVLLLLYHSSQCSLYRDIYRIVNFVSLYVSYREAVYRSGSNCYVSSLLYQPYHHTNYFKWLVLCMFVAVRRGYHSEKTETPISTRGAPRVAITNQQLSFLVQCGFTAPRMSQLLCVSLRTVKRRLR